MHLFCQLVWRAPIVKNEPSPDVGSWYISTGLDDSICKLTSSMSTLGRVTRTHPIDRRLESSVPYIEPHVPFLPTRDTLPQRSTDNSLCRIPQPELIDGLLNDDANHFIRETGRKSKFCRLDRQRRP
jgi:hypothetical protein